MNDIIIVHGIWTHGGGIDRFGKMLEDAGFRVRYFEYPRRFALSMYWPGVEAEDGAALANFMRDGDHIVAHSYGVRIWQNTIPLGAQWGKCYLFGGAATSDKMFYHADALKEAHVIYNPEDNALKIGSILPFHPFGKLGLRGYVGQPGRKTLDRRFINIDGFSDSHGVDHSHYWKRDKYHWYEYVTEDICKS